MEKTTIGYTKEEGGKISLIQIHGSELDILVQIVRNLQQNYTIVEDPLFGSQYKMKSIFFLKDQSKAPWEAQDNIKFIFDCSFGNFRPNSGLPSWWIRLHLKLIILLGI